MIASIPQAMGKVKVVEVVMRELEELANDPDVLIHQIIPSTVRRVMVVYTVQR